MLMQAARPHLKKAKGAIVNFGSISARVAQVGRWVYPVSKAAILQLTRNQALDLAPDGIRVNAVVARLDLEQHHAAAQQRQPRQDRQGRRALPSARRTGDPARSARRSRSCCRTAASFITGTDIRVDGGYTAIGPERIDPAIPLLME